MVLYSRALQVLMLLAALCGPLPAADVISETFAVNGVNICYQVQGTGTPVVLIHGLHSSASMNWRLPGVVDRLAKSFQVIAIDLPGHGRSDKPSLKEAYGEQLAADVVLLLDHLKIEKAHIVGYSMGGMIAMKLLAQHPQRFRSAVIGGMGWMREGTYLAGSWERMRVRDGGRTPAECINSLGDLALTEAEVKGIHVPVLVVVGDRDPVRRMYVVPLQMIRPDWQVIQIPGAGHLNCIMQAQFLDAIADWLTRRTRSHPEEE